MEKNLFVTKNENKKMIYIEELYDRGEFLKALKEIESYLALYPRDLKALYLQGKMLRMLKHNNEAREAFIKLFPYITENKEYEKKILIELIYLGIYERNYLDAYSYLERLEKVVSFGNTKCLNMGLVKVFLKRQLGMKIEPDETKKSNYFEAQLLNYSEDRALKRLQQSNENYRHFYDDVDVRDLFVQINSVISIAKITPAYNVFDTYIFYYPEAGYDEEGVLDYVQVLAYTDDFDNVKILEISPFRVKKYKEYINDLIDLEYQKEYLEDILKLNKKID